MRSGPGFLSRPALVSFASGLGGAALWAGRRALPPPPVPRPAQWEAWWQATGPVDAVFALARCGMLAVVVVVGLLSAAVLAVRLLSVAGHTGPVAWSRFARWSSSGGRGRMGRLLLGFSASGGLLAGCGLPGDGATSGASGPLIDTPQAPVLAGPVAGPAAGLKLTEPVGARSAGSPARAEGAAPGRVPDRVEGAAGRGDAPAATPPRRIREVAPAPHSAAAPEGAAPEPPTWTVEPGDDFWSIAETVVGRPATGPADSSRVAPYWSRLVAANRDRLAVPGDPDLLFPGQVLVLPPLTGPVVAPD